MLMPDLMREVMELIPSNHGHFAWLDPDFEFTNGYGTFPEWVVDLYLKHFYNEKTILPRRNIGRFPTTKSVLRVEECLLDVDWLTFLRSDFYNVIWRPAGAHDGLIVPIRTAGRVQGTLYLLREAAAPLIEARDVKVLESIAGFVAHGLTSTRESNCAFVGTDDRALFVTDRQGALKHAGIDAQRLLRMAFSSRTPERRIENRPPMIAQLCGSLTSTAAGQIGRGPPALRLRNNSGEFVLRAYWFEPTDGTEQTRHIGITIERRVPRALALRRRIEELSLTGREKQLCLLLAHDRSRQDLADAMGVSTGTVITHQSSVYSKLGVHSRAGLLAALLPG
jgi:DNA-binding CsgD family transcriptional regulator